MQNRRRVIAAILVGVLVGAVSVGYSALYLHNRGSTNYAADFDHLHSAARLVLDGRDPYPLIGPHRAFHNRWPLYYPLPAVILLMPLAALPVEIARALFIFLTGGVLGFAIAVQGGTKWRFALIASRQYVDCILLAHWTPLFYAMWVLPGLSVISVIKPTITGPILAAKAEARRIGLAVICATALLGVSFLLQPHWVSSWLQQVRTADHFTIPLLRPGGFLLLMALLRWRRADARLLLLLAVMPQTPSYYDALLLFLFADTTAEIGVLLAAGYVLDAIVLRNGQFPTGRLAIAEIGRWSILMLYLPVLIMVLRRPNTGELPQWIERWTPRVPRWLRGQSTMPT